MSSGLKSAKLSINNSVLTIKGQWNGSLVSPATSFDIYQIKLSGTISEYVPQPLTVELINGFNINLFRDVIRSSNFLDNNTLVFQADNFDVTTLDSKLIQDENYTIKIKGPFNDFKPWIDKTITSIDFHSGSRRVTLAHAE